MCERCAELEERVKQLEEMLVAPGTLPATMGLTPSEDRVLRHLIARGRINLTSAIVAIYGRGDPPDTVEDIFRRHIAAIRRKAVPKGLMNVYGGNYELEEAQRVRLRAMLLVN